MIHVDPFNPVAVNNTCRYCRACNFLIAHKDEIEEQLVLLFTRIAPMLMGNDYLVIGTQDRADRRQDNILNDPGDAGLVTRF